MSFLLRQVAHCDVCGHEWIVIAKKTPIHCASCKSRKWNQDTMAKIAEGAAEAQRITKMKPIPFGVQQYDRPKHSPRCTCTTCKPPK